MDFHSAFNEKWGGLTREIICLLCEDSRMSVTEIAGRLGVSRKTVITRLKKAETALGIKYTLELDDVALGLTNPHIVAIKFKAKPDYTDIKHILESSHVPQLAVMVSGTYDMLVYANAENQNEYVFWDKTTRVVLSKYEAVWQASDLAFRHLGFFPIRNSLLERLRIPKRYLDMLLLLNENARMSVNEMSKRLGIKQRTLNYDFSKMLKMGYIKRFTLIMQKPVDTVMVPLFGKYAISAGFENDSMSMRKEITFRDDKLPIVSRCLFSAQLIGSYDFFFIGVYDDYETGYRQLVKYYKERFRKHSVNAIYGAAGETLLGTLPVRSLDPKKNFNMIRWTPGSKMTVERPD